MSTLENEIAALTSPRRSVNISLTDSEVNTINEHADALGIKNRGELLALMVRRSMPAIAELVAAKVFDPHKATPAPNAALQDE